MDGDFWQQLAALPGQQVIWLRDSLIKELQFFYQKAESLAEVLDTIGRILADEGVQAISADVEDELIFALREFATAVHGVYNKAQQLEDFYCSCPGPNCDRACDEYENYKTKLSEHEIGDATNFFIGLRVLVTKIETPRLRHRTKRNIFDVRTGKVVVNKRRFESWARKRQERNEGALRYLKDASDYLPLRQEITDYRNGMDGFYGWFIREVNQAYEEEMNERDEFIESRVSTEQ